MTDTPEPVPTDLADPALESALQAFAAHPVLLVALDFDGTVAPLVDHADDARALPTTARVLERLSALPGVHVALVSGRPLEFLSGPAGAGPDTLLIGSHGAERRLGPRTEPLVLTEGQQATLTRVDAVLERTAASTPGAWVEAKPAGRVLHVRQVPEAQAAEAAVHRAEHELSALASEDEDLHLTHGKAVLEVSVVRADKGEGLEILRRHTHADAVLFVGDDLTDEHGFAVLTPGVDVGIKVGPGPTSALHRVESPHEVALILETVAAWRG